MPMTIMENDKVIIMFTSDSAKKFKVIIVGNMNVGKSSLFWRFTQNTFLQEKDQVTTIDYGMKLVTVQGVQVKLCIWDTAGQQKYRNIISSYFKGCDGVIAVFDLSTPQTFEDINKVWMRFIRQKTDGAKIVLVGNKADLAHKVSREEINAVCSREKIVYVEASVKSNKGVQQAFLTLARELLADKMPSRAQRVQSVTIKGMSQGQKDQKKKKKDCC